MIDVSTAVYDGIDNMERVEKANVEHHSVRSTVSLKPKQVVQPQTPCSEPPLNSVTSQAEMRKNTTGHT
jgi:hypothetical protein